MRIDRLHIRHYGPLQPREFDLSAGCEGLHVVYGGNEWGKSLSLQALEHGLFSIPRTIGGFSSDDMAQLELVLGLSRKVKDATTRLEFMRRRQSLLAVDTNQPIEQRSIEAYLGDVSAETFRQMYGLSAERIREGGRLLQNAKGDIAATLFAAATGLEHIQAVSYSIDTRLHNLYSKDTKAIKPALNNALQAIREGFAAFSGTIQSPEMVKRLETQWQEAAGEIKIIDEHLRRCSEQVGHLGRVRAARTAANQLNAARQRLTDLGKPPLLTDTFRTRLDAARPSLTLALRNIQQLSETLTDQRRRCDAIAVDERVTVAAHTINALLQSTGELQGIDEGIQHRRDDITRLSNANADLFRNIAAMTGRNIREAAAQSAGTLGQIDSLIQQHGGITTACEEREKQLKDGHKKLASLETRLEGLAVVADTSDLKRRLAAVRDAGDLEQRCAAVRGKLGIASEAYEASCQRLDGRPADAPVESLRVPSLDEVRDYRERFRGLEKERVELEGEIHRSKAAITSLESAIALLEQGVDLPGEGELERVRGERDAILAATATAAAGGTIVAADAPHRFEEIDRLVRQADNVVDRLLVLADSVSQRGQHRIAIEGHLKQVGHVEERQQQLATRIATAEHEWARLWEEAGVTPKAPVAMEAWLGIHVECCKQADSLKQQQRELHDLEQQIDLDRGVLTGILVELEEQPVADATRRQLIDRLTNVLDDLQAKSVTRKETEDQITKAKQEIPRLEALAEEATTQRNAWNVQWAECMNVLDQPTDASVPTGRFLLDTMREVAANELAVASARHRIDQMQEKRANIHDVMRQVCTAIDVAFDPAGIQALSRTASDRLRESETAKAQRDSLDGDIATTDARIAAVRNEQAAHEAILATLRAEARVDADDALDQAWERSQAFREVKQLVDGAEQAFLQEAGRADRESLLQECLAATAEGIEQQLADIERQSNQLRERRDSARDRQRQLQIQLDALGNDRSTRAATDLRMHEAAVLERVREYIPLRLAALALDRASRRYRDEHHAPVLGRASELFKRITCGSYAEIRLAENELYAIRSGTTPVSVPQRHMSEGTRDQIYLALRLAALAHSHTQGAEPLPLILDDGLVHFDDQRTTAMLEVLADVSAGMQVILFTHHASVVAAARAVQTAKPDAVFLHGDAA